jgi:NitT/TauT family transport system substrate-binding protein
MTQINIMALRHSAFYSPLLMTIAGGYLREEGLEANYTVATPQCTVPDSIHNGTCHVAQSAVATSFAGLERGESTDIVHFAQINEKDGFFLAGRQPEPDFTWDRLIGKKVLVDHFFQPLAMFTYALHKNEIELSQLDVIDAGDVKGIDDTFRSGEGDYVQQQGPAPQQLHHEGLAYVVAAIGDVIGPVAFSSLCASRGWLETDMAKAFMRAYTRARKYVTESPAEEIAAQEAEAGFFPGIDRQILADTIKAYQKLGCWLGNTAISTPSYETLLDVFMFSDLIDQRYDYNSVIVQPPG